MENSQGEQIGKLSMLEHKNLDQVIDSIFETLKSECKSKKMVPCLAVIVPGVFDNEKGLGTLPVIPFVDGSMGIISTQLFERNKEAIILNLNVKYSFLFQGGGA